MALAVPLSDLLDEDVDLTSARRLSPPGSAPLLWDELAAGRDRLANMLSRLPLLLPDLAPHADQRSEGLARGIAG
jgi:hypothetical protein